MIIELIDWITTNHIGDLASVIGVLIAIVGFWITIQNVIRSKRAADRAESAARETLKGVRYIDIVQNLSRAISIIEEIQRLNRAKEWKVLLDRHSNLRNLLIEVKGLRSNLSDTQKRSIQAGITHSKSMSHKIEVALGKKAEPADIPKMNKILSDQVEKLRAILVEIRMNMDG